MKLLFCFLYSLFLYAYYATVWVFSFFNPKAKYWIAGRKEWRNKLASFSSPKTGKRIWFHCASLGEFEQARPLIDEYLKANKETIIILTFFSPSGYLVREKFALADLVLYLPFDFKKECKSFVSILKPDTVYWIKYDFWANMLDVIYVAEIPIYLVAGIFRKEQVFFKWYGVFFRAVLKKFTLLFIQDSASCKLLDNINIQAKIVGDTRFDRVYAIAQLTKKNDFIIKFNTSKKIIVIGSAWQKEVLLFSQIFDKSFKDSYLLIIAPHNVNEVEINFIENCFQNETVRFSSFNEKTEKPVIILDNIGMLSKLYAYAHLAFIGGGFGSSVHNVLEAAVFGVPTLFGPHHQKSKEALDLVELGGAFCIQTKIELNKQIEKLAIEKNRETASSIAQKYVEDRLGATAKIYSKTSS